MLPHWTFLPWRTKKSSVTVVLLTFSLASVYEGWLRTWVWPGSADQRAKPSSEPLLIWSHGTHWAIWTWLFDLQQTWRSVSLSCVNRSGAGGRPPLKAPSFLMLTWHALDKDQGTHPHKQTFIHCLPLLCSPLPSWGILHKVHVKRENELAIKDTQGWKWELAKMIN